MAWKIFQRFGRFAQSRQVAMVTATSATIAVGLVLYEKVKAKVAHADSSHDWHSHSRTNLSERGSGDSNISDTSGNVRSSVTWDDNWDRRDPASLVKPPKTEKAREAFSEKVKEKTPTASRHLVLIRHGQFIHIDADDQLRLLTILGQEQAELTGQRLRDLDLNYTRMVSSTMSRAVETADIIHKYLPVRTLERDDLLCEGRPIVPEPVLHWRPEYYYFQDGARIEAAFRKYVHRADPKQTENSVEIIVCHANVIRYFVCRALQLPPEAWNRISLAHGSLTHLIIMPSGRVYLEGLGSAGHMPPSKVTVSSRGRPLL